jgi:nucleotide-binding universal stress UspA family protein
VERMYKKILVATDGTQHSASAIIEAIDMSRKFGSEIYLLHALKKIVVGDPYGVSRSVIEEKIQQSTMKYLDTFRGMAADDGVITCEVIVSHGREFHEAILEEAAKRSIDLIMVGRSVSNVVTRIIYRGVTSHLLRHSPCNVLIVPLAALIQWRNIILVLDHTIESTSALTEALRLAKVHNSELIVVHVSTPTNETHGIPNVKEQAAIEGITVEEMDAGGKPSDFVVNLSKERDTDIIITRSPEAGGVKGHLKKSFTEQIITRSICAVLVVKG